MAERRTRRRIPAARTPSGLVRGEEAVTDWAAIREWVLDRDDHVCQICRIRPATDVDHIWPRRLGGEDHVDNLRAACGPCNKAKGDRVEMATATDNQLALAIAEFGRRGDELEAEQHVFLNEMFMRALGADPEELALSSRYLRSVGEVLEARARRLDLLSEKLLASAKRGREVAKSP